MARGDLETALAAYEGMVETYEEPEAVADAAYGKIEALTRLGRTDEALAQCDEALSLARGRPNDEARVLCVKARIARDQGRHQDAEAIYREARDLEPTEAWALREVGRGLAEVAVALGRIDEGLAAVAALIAADPDPESLANACLGKIEALSRGGRKIEALEVCRTAIDRVRTRPKELGKLLCARGRLCRGLGRRDEAKEAYRTVLDLGPTEDWILREAENALAVLP